ncbi:MAG: bifunctional folylpolyglutamate synthase/dihydrofolate synthase [Bacteroidia bacterium]|nr:bifunctional folylpolyglutamate synthase/dihydrofolate synthase [Bacteroidia bacterium]
MNYSEAIAFIYSTIPMFHMVGKKAYKADLNNTLALDKHLKNPHKSFKAIHIAGTNGKGSVSHMLASVLQDSGYRTGLFTSPHIKDFRERIKVNGLMISEDEVAEFVTKNKSFIEKIQPSFFELTTLMAFDHFRAHEVEYALIETGLGGRLDSTNIIKPILSVITNISWDHADLLGDSLAKIAAEKAGIIKQNIPVIIGEFQNEINLVFEDRADELNAELTYADSIYIVNDSIQTVDDLQMFRIEKSKKPFLEGLKTPLLGNYQKKNVSTVLAAIEKLNEKGLQITDSNIYRGIKNVINTTGLKGRWQVLSQKPMIICDIGHNEGGIKLIVSQLQKIKKDKLHIVFGLVADKEVSKILELLPKDAIYYFTNADSPRALKSVELKKLALEFGLKGESFSSVQAAFTKAKKSAKPDDVVFVGGSTFVVAEVL